MKIRRIFVYETPARYYLIGANSERTEFRVLKIDRSDAVNLQLVEDSHVYSSRQIVDMQSMLKSTNSLFRRVCIGCGILGFVKFLQGYYLLIATKRVKVGAVPSNVYRIADTQMIYLPAQQQTSSEEQKLVKLFQNVDLRSNFYFSYDFDLTRSFQSNWLMCTEHIGEPDLQCHSGCEPGMKRNNMTVCEKFVWNWRMTESLRERNDVSSDWLFYIIHGYFGQAVINAGRCLYLILIARRSRHYAGTRYLKRGSNWQGYVANEVEVEQALVETSCSPMANWPPLAVSSYVQVRGSVPVLWSHDIHQKVMTPKPPIQLDLFDPYFSVTAIHFDQLLTRFGAPVIVLNLLKRLRREALIGDHLQDGIAYLNQFCPRAAQIRLVCVDLARLKKHPRNVLDGSALDQLTCVCEALFYETDCFAVYAGTMSNRQHGVVRSNCIDCLDRTNIAQFVIGRVAIGHQLYALHILDRPNGAELDESELIRVLETMYEECGNTLALQYGGSQLAHTVEAYRPARKYSKPKIVTQSRDFVQTVSRFYSNTFSDAVKQASLNVFGGLINVERAVVTNDLLSAPRNGEPSSFLTSNSNGKPPSTLLADETVEPDYYLHNDVPAGRCPGARYSYTQWFTPLVIKYLPFAVADTCMYSYVPAGVNATCVECTFIDNNTNTLVNTLSIERNSCLYDALYKPYRWSVLEKHVQRQLVEVPLFDAATYSHLRTLHANGANRFSRAVALRGLVEAVLKLRAEFRQFIHIDSLIVDGLMRRCSLYSKRQLQLYGRECTPRRMRKTPTSPTSVQQQSKPIWSRYVELNGNRIDLHVAFVTLGECSSQQHLGLLQHTTLNGTNLQNVPLSQVSRFEREVLLGSVSLANENRQLLATDKLKLAVQASRPGNRQRVMRDNDAICASYLDIDRLCASDYEPLRSDAELYARYTLCSTPTLQLAASPAMMQSR